MYYLIQEAHFSLQNSKNSEKKEKFCSEISRCFAAKNGHHDLDCENVFAAFRGETKTVMT